MKLLVKYDSEEIRERAPLKFAVQGDCGLDLYNASEGAIIVYPKKSVLVNSGLRVKIPNGCCGFIKGRSSTFHKRGLFVVEGVIDSGYVGPLFSHVWNPGLNGNEQPQIINPWERLSQLVILPIPAFQIEVVNEMPTTARGENGFGSSGR